MDKMDKQINNITNEDIYFFMNDKRGGSLNEYQRIATKSAIYPGQGTPLGLMYVALKLNGEAGELAEHVGKAMRDDGFGMYDGFNELTADRLDLITKEAGDILWYLSALCNEIKATMSTIAQVNLTKLKSRTDRNKLQGSGDER